MKPKLGTLVLCAALGLGGTVQGADYSDPSWPCIQRKVESLSVGLMWPYPVEDTERAADVQDDIDELASRFALRRLELEEIEPALAAFTAKHGRNPDLLGAVFVDAFDRLSATRKAIMKGIRLFILADCPRGKDRCGADRDDRADGGGKARFRQGRRA